MNRRSFFKTVTGFVAGVYVACVPGKKSLAKSIEYVKVTEGKGEDFAYWPQKHQKIKWRKWGDVKCPCDKCTQLRGESVFKLDDKPFETLRNYTSGQVLKKPWHQETEPLTEGKVPPETGGARWERWPKPKGVILNDDFVHKLTVKTKPKTMNKVDIDKIYNLL